MIIIISLFIYFNCYEKLSQQSHQFHSFVIFAFSPIYTTYNKLFRVHAISRLSWPFSFSIYQDPPCNFQVPHRDLRNFDVQLPHCARFQLMICEDFPTPFVESHMQSCTNSKHIQLHPRHQKHLLSDCSLLQPLSNDCIISIDE